jgi:hypothetical protein
VEYSSTGMLFIVDERQKSPRTMSKSAVQVSPLKWYVSEEYYHWHRYFPGK